MVMPGGAGELLDELRAGRLAHDLPGLIHHDELRLTVPPDRVPQDAQHDQLSDVADLRIADVREPDNQ